MEYGHMCHDTAYVYYALYNVHKVLTVYYGACTRLEHAVLVHVPQ